MEIHMGKKRFTCDHCKRGFFTRFNLLSHMKTHKNQAKEEPKVEQVVAQEEHKILKPQATYLIQAPQMMYKVMQPI